MNAEFIVGILQTVSEGTFQTLIAFLLVLILSEVRPSDMNNIDDWKWKITSCRMHWLSNFQLFMFIDIIATSLYKIWTSSDSNRSSSPTAMCQIYISRVYNCLSRLTYKISCQITKDFKQVAQLGWKHHAKHVARFSGSILRQKNFEVDFVYDRHPALSAKRQSRVFEPPFGD